MNARWYLAFAGLASFAALGAIAHSADSNLMAMIPHHDHTSRRGGPVLMNGDTHFEVVVRPDGTHAVLFSDAFRKPLPASDIEEVTLTFLRDGKAAESLALRPDPSEEGTWSGSGSRLEAREIETRVTYVPAASRQPYSIDLPITLHAH